MQQIVLEAARTEAWLRQHGRPVVKLLRRGVSLAEIEEAENALGFSFPAELVALLQWHDGTDNEESVSLDGLSFYPGYYLLSLEEARSTVAIYRSEPIYTRFQSWEPGWFPVFASGAGDFQLVDCLKGDGEHAPVICFLKGEPDRPVEYASLTAMLSTIADCYERGIFFESEARMLEADYEKWAELARLTLTRGPTSGHGSS